jgi:hypothetical protein
VYLTNPCGCCADSGCTTWEVTNTASGVLTFEMRGCDNTVYTYTLQADEVLQFCGLVGQGPKAVGGGTVNPKLSFEVLSSCGCTAPYPCTIVPAITAIATNNMTVTSPLGTFPAIYQCTGWGIGSGSNHTGRITNVNTFPTDPTGLTEGETYYVTMELSVPIPRDMGYWFGRNIVSPSATTPDMILPAGSTFAAGNLVWNAGSIFGFFTKIGANLSPGWDGIVTVNVYKGNCGRGV